MTLPSGGHARLDNGWLTDFIRGLPTAEAVCLYLQAKGGLHRKGADIGELISALGKRDLRTVERTIKALVIHGRIVLADGRYYAPAFAPAERPGNSPASAPGDSPGNSSNAQEEKSNQHAKNGSELSPEEEKEEKKRSKDKNTPLTPQGGEGGTGESGQGPGEEAPTPLTGLPGPSAGTGPVLAGRGPDVPRRRAADHAPPVPLPDLPPALAARPGVPAAWARWLEFRRQSGLKTVAATAETHHAELQRLAAEGYDPAHVLTECINRGWRGVFPPKTKTPDVPRNLRLDPPGDDADAQKDWLA